MNEDQTRRGRVTPENVEESRLLRAIYEREPRGTQAEFGETWGIGNQSAVGNMLNGRQAISMLAAAKFAKALNCSISDFSSRLATQAAEIGKLAYPPNVATLQSSTWPFSPGLLATLRGLDREKIAIIETTVRSLAESLRSPGEAGGNTGVGG